MRKWMAGSAALTLMLSGAAAAQDKDAATIQVTGTATMETAPEIAGISYDVLGEGPTSDDAVRAMEAKRAAIEKALAAFGGGLRIETNQMRVNEMRGPGCTMAYAAIATSEGNCAVRGYGAQIGVNLRVSPAASAGTLSGLASRAGASNVALSGFWLNDSEPVRQRALIAALADGRKRAEAIAAASGARLGPLLRVADPYPGNQAAQWNLVSAASRPRVEAVEVNISPRPVQTSASLTLTYAIER